jgi:uncharacterized membrane protein YfcA
MDALEGILLALAAFAAGGVNAIAGGGSLISFPALVGVGYAARTANVTNSVALLPGYLGGSLGYRAELRDQRRQILALLPVSIVGAVAGSAILLLTPESTFEAMVPFLIFFACGLLAFQGRIRALTAGHHVEQGDATGPVLQAGIFLLGVYTAYFGAGAGILSLAILASLLPDDIQRSNALKGLLSLVMNGVAVAIFTVWGPVRWGAALVMAVGAIAGGYAGARVARRLDARRLRFVAIAYGLVAGVIILVT